MFLENHSFAQVHRLLTRAYPVLEWLIYISVLMLIHHKNHYVIRLTVGYFCNSCKLNSFNTFIPANELFGSTSLTKYKSDLL